LKSDFLTFKQNKYKKNPQEKKKMTDNLTPRQVQELLLHIVANHSSLPLDITVLCRLLHQHHGLSGTYPVVPLITVQKGRNDKFLPPTVNTFFLHTPLPNSPVPYKTTFPFFCRAGASVETARDSFIDNLGWNRINNTFDFSIFTQSSQFYDESITNLFYSNNNQGYNNNQGAVAGNNNNQTRVEEVDETRLLVEYAKKISLLENHLLQKEAYIACRQIGSTTAALDVLGDKIIEEIQEKRNLEPLPFMVCFAKQSIELCKFEGNEGQAQKFSDVYETLNDMKNRGVNDDKISRAISICKTTGNNLLTYQNQNQN
jgi:hypothetical protein